MSAIDYLVSGTQQTQTAPAISSGTQNWNGQQIPANIGTHNLLNYDAKTGNKTFKLPDFVGGGVYTEDAQGRLLNTGHGNYGGEPAVKGDERDDKIPVSLGGDNSNSANIQDEPMSIAGPQDKVEKNAAKAVKQGTIQPKAALTQVLRQKQQIAGQEPKESTLSNFPSALKDTLSKFIPHSVKERAGAVQQSIEYKSLSPLKQSFANQAKQFVQTHVPQPGDDKQTQLAKAQNLAFLFSGEAAPEGEVEGAAKNAETVTKPIPSRVQDVTPNYHPDMAGDYVQNANGETIPRVNEGTGLKTRTVNTSAAELKNAEEVSKIANYPDKGTALQKSQSIHGEISKEAENLKTSLAEEDKSAPLVPEAKDIVTKNVLNNMPGEARDGFMNRGSGATAKAGLPEEPVRTVLGKYGNQMAEAVNNYDGSRVGILDLRQTADNIYKDARGKAAYGSEHRNALDQAHTSVRDYLNRELKESTTNTDTQASLDKQTRLYRAKDVLDTKAAKENPTALGRYGQRHPVQKRIASSTAMRVGMGLGIGALAGGSIYTVGKKLGQKIGTVPTPKPKVKAKPKIKL